MPLLLVARMPTMSSALQGARSALQLPRSLSARAMSILNHTDLPELPLSAPSPQDEDSAFAERVASVEKYFALPRFSGIKRNYSATDVASKQGFLPTLPLPSALTADKLWRLFSERSKEGKPVHTMGAVDPVQMTQMARWQEVLYVSGWACSSLLTTGSNEVGPDLGCVLLLA